MAQATVERPAPVSASVRDALHRGNGALALAGTAAAVSIVKYGVGIHPEWRRLQDAALHWPDLAQSPLIMEGDRSLLSNITTAWASGAVGAGTPLRYLALSLALTLLAIALPFLMPALRGNPVAVRIAFVMVVGGPVPAVLLGWVGGYDAVLVIALAVAALARNRWVSAAGWFVVAFSHAAVAVVAVALWALVVIAAEPAGRGRAALLSRASATRTGAAVVAVLAGWLSIRAVTDAWGGSTDRLALLRAIPVEHIASAYVASLPLMVFSVLGVGWFVLLHPAVRRAAVGRVMLVEAVAVTLLVPWIAVDETRVSALVLFAAVLTFVATIPATLTADDGRQIWRTLVIPATVLPVIVVWMGQPMFHPWPGVVELLHAAGH